MPVVPLLPACSWSQEGEGEAWWEGCEGDCAYQDGLEGTDEQQELPQVCVSCVDTAPLPAYPLPASCYATVLSILVNKQALRVRTRCKARALRIR